MVIVGLGFVICLRRVLRGRARKRLFPQLPCAYLEHLELISFNHNSLRKGLLHSAYERDV